MRSKKIKFGRGNGMLPTPAPAFLEKLWPAEEMMIALVNVNIKLYIKKWGMPGMVG